MHEPNTGNFEGMFCPRKLFLVNPDADLLKNGYLILREAKLTFLTGDWRVISGTGLTVRD